MELKGFGKLDKVNNSVINKIVGTYTKKYRDVLTDFEKLHLHMKPVHGSNKKVEIHGKVVAGGQVYSSEITDFNLYFTLDKVLRKLHSSIKQ